MKPKKLPRLWCALQGLLPLEACLAAQQAELAWPASHHAAEAKSQRAVRHGDQKKGARAKPSSKPRS